MKPYKKGSSCGFSGASRSRVMENQQQTGKTGKCETFPKLCLVLQTDGIS